MKWAVSLFIARLWFFLPVRWVVLFLAYRGPGRVASWVVANSPVCVWLHDDCIARGDWVGAASMSPIANRYRDRF